MKKTETLDGYKIQNRLNKVAEKINSNLKRDIKRLRDKARASYQKEVQKELKCCLNKVFISDVDEEPSAHNKFLNTNQSRYYFKVTEIYEPIMENESEEVDSVVGVDPEIYLQYDILEHKKGRLVVTGNNFWTLKEIGS